MGPRVGPCGPVRKPLVGFLDRSLDAVETWDWQRRAGLVGAGWAPAAGAAQVAGGPTLAGLGKTTTTANAGRDTNFFNEKSAKLGLDLIQLFDIFDLNDD
jgi:hypothetical protein